MGIKVMLIMRALRPFWSKKSGRVAMPFMNYGINRRGCVNAKTLFSKLALQLSFCFEVRTLSDRLVSSAPQ
jgi:hypothetical protein